jgi:hypothetical protein
MPVYRLLCDGCGAEQDLFRRIAEIDRDLPVCCGASMHRKVCAPAVIGDIQPYQAMGVDVATGTAPVIRSRSEHRDYLRRNNYIEVGNEMPTPPSARKIEGDFNVRAELTQAVREVLPRYTA